MVPNRIFWKLLIKVGGACLLVLIAAAGVGCNRDPKHKQPSMIAAANDDYPHTLTELNAWYAEPPENAATFYLRGFDALKLGNGASSKVPLFGKGKLPDLGASMPTALKFAVAALVQSNREALQSFPEATKYEQS